MDKLFLGVGAMKSGTTWLFRQLEQHPQIRFSPEKELHFLAWQAGYRDSLRFTYRASRWAVARQRTRAQGRRQSASETGWYLDYLLAPKGWNWYQRRFGNVPANSYPADFSNLTALLSENDWEKLAARVADLRLVYVLRHPLDRIWSQLRAGCASEEERNQLASASQYIPRSGSSELDLLRHSRYGENLQRIFQSIPRDRVQVILYEQISEQPESLLRDTERFLGIDKHDYLPEKLNRRINASAELARPAWVAEHFLPRLEEDLSTLSGLGIQVPAEWCQ